MIFPDISNSMWLVWRRKIFIERHIKYIVDLHRVIQSYLTSSSTINIIQKKMKLSNKLFGISFFLQKINQNCSINYDTSLSIGWLTQSFDWLIFSGFRCHASLWNFPSFQCHSHRRYPDSASLLACSSYRSNSKVEFVRCHTSET